MAKLIVDVELSDFSNAFLKALSKLIDSIQHADRALLEDSIRDANDELVAVLTAGSFLEKRIDLPPDEPA